MSRRTEEYDAADKQNEAVMARVIEQLGSMRDSGDTEAAELLPLMEGQRARYRWDTRREMS